MMTAFKEGFICTSAFLFFMEFISIYWRADKYRSIKTEIFTIIGFSVFTAPILINIYKAIVRV